MLILFTGKKNSFSCADFSAIRGLTGFFLLFIVSFSLRAQPAEILIEPKTGEWKISWQKEISGVFGLMYNSESVKGLAIHFHGHRFAPLDIVPVKEIFISGVMHEFNLEISAVYASGRFLLEIADIEGKVIRLDCCKVRKSPLSEYTVKIPFSVKTRPSHPFAAHGLTFRKIIFIPDSGTRTRNVFILRKFKILSLEPYRIPGK